MTQEHATVTRADIADVFHQKIGVSKRQCYDVMHTIIEEICGSLAEGEQVKLPGFGTFAVLEKTPRVGRNPATGVEAVISARRVVQFKASKMLKDKVNT